MAKEKFTKEMIYVSVAVNLKYKKGFRFTAVSMAKELVQANMARTEYALEGAIVSSKGKIRTRKPPTAND